MCFDTESAGTLHPQDGAVYLAHVDDPIKDPQTAKKFKRWK
jgi:hypothetical protein